MIIEVPRDREGTFEPQIVPSHQGAVKEVSDSAGGRRPASDRLYREGQSLKTKKSRGNSNGTPRLLYRVYDKYTTLKKQPLLYFFYSPAFFVRSAKNGAKRNPEKPGPARTPAAPINCNSPL
jgi:hypothetical protein